MLLPFLTRSTLIQVGMSANELFRMFGHWVIYELRCFSFGEEIHHSVDGCGCAVGEQGEEVHIQSTTGTYANQPGRRFSPGSEAFASQSRYLRGRFLRRSRPNVLRSGLLIRRAVPVKLVV